MSWSGGLSVARRVLVKFSRDVSSGLLLSKHDPLSLHTAPLPNARAGARRRVNLSLLVRMLTPLRVIGYPLRPNARAGARRRVISSSARHGLQHTASRRRRSAKNGRSFSLPLLLDADSSTWRVGVGDQLKTVLRSLRKSADHTLFFGPTRTPAHRHGESAVGRSLRRSADQQKFGADSSTRHGELAVIDQRKRVEGGKAAHSPAVVSAPSRLSAQSSRTNGTPLVHARLSCTPASCARPRLVHARGRRHTPQREA